MTQLFLLLISFLISLLTSILVLYVYVIWLTHAKASQSYIKKQQAKLNSRSHLRADVDFQSSEEVTAGIRALQEQFRANRKK